MRPRVGALGSAGSSGPGSRHVRTRAPNTPRLPRVGERHPETRLREGAKAAVRTEARGSSSQTRPGTGSWRPWWEWRPLGEKRGGVNFQGPTSPGDEIKTTSWMFMQKRLLRLEGQKLRSVKCKPLPHPSAPHFTHRVGASG